MLHLKTNKKHLSEAFSGMAIVINVLTEMYLMFVSKFYNVHVNVKNKTSEIHANLKVC